MNTATAALLAKLKAKTNMDNSDSVLAPEAAPKQEIKLPDPPAGASTDVPASAVPAAPVVVDLYQQYTSARVSTCLITQSGKRINFTNYQYSTKDPEIIAYLDREIANGLIGFTKGKRVTAEELNPEIAKKRKIIEEFKASQEGREFGNTKDVADRSTALSSDQVAK